MVRIVTFLTAYYCVYTAVELLAWLPWDGRGTGWFSYVVAWTRRRLWQLEGGDPFGNNEAATLTGLDFVGDSWTSPL